jgi:hypothetical protein
MAQDTKSKVVAAAQQLSAATAKHLASGTQVSLLGSSFTPDQVTTKLQSVVTLRDNVNAARSSLKAAIAAEAAQTPDLRSFMAAYESYVKAAFGSSIDVLNDFGLAPKSRTPLSAEATIAAVAKRASTRAARHTMGPKQKLGVKGDVTGVTVTTNHAAAPAAIVSSSPSAPANSGAPAAASSPTTPANGVGPTAAATPHTA